MKKITNKEEAKKYLNVTHKKKKRSKYGNKWTEYNGVKYQSKKEAEYARELDMLQKATDDSQRVEKWERQVKYPIEVKGSHIANYYLDFKVWYADGRVEYVDVKGHKTQVYKIKKKLVEALHDIEIKEV